MKTSRTSATSSKRDAWFFALQPSASARDAINRLQDELRTRHAFRDYRVKPENLHISLHALGEGDALPAGRLEAARAAAANLVFESFELTFDRAGSFPLKQEKKPFVLFPTVAAVAPLKAFHRALGAALLEGSVGDFVRPHFTPHLTLFWDSVVVEPHSLPPIDWTVDEFVLVRSHHGKGRHEIVGRWPLRAPASVAPRRSASPDYVELHARSAFSFLRGASLPEDYVKSAMEVAHLPALALLDRDGVYGAPRFYGSAQENKFAVRPRVGAEITMEDGTVVPLLATNRTGYQNLCQLITEAKMTERVERVDLNAFKSSPASAIPEARWGQRTPPADLPTPTDRKRPCFATWEELARFSEGLVALTGDEEGPVRSAWRNVGNAAASAALDKLAAIFGRESDPARARLFVEVQRQRIRGENREVTFLRDLAAAHRLPLLATGGVNYAIADHRIVADVFTCLRHHTTLDAAGRKLAVNSERHLKSAREMQALFPDLPEALANSVRLEQRLDFTLQNLGYQFPTYSTPHGESMDAFLREITFAAARRKVRADEWSRRWEDQLLRELELIARLKFSGYFLIVWDICRWAREQSILVQGRGSAANSAVCYVLGITAVDPIKNQLLFERFLNDSRVGPDGNPSWPDIDLDFPSGDRRERVIQEVYARYGRRGAAMTANVITYRGRSTIREVGKVLGFGDDALDRFSSLYANGDFPETLDLQEQLRLSGIAAHHPRAEALVRLQHQFRRALPRHLGQHSGGMVICQHQLDKVMPLEPATMPDRSVCQWDKDDCENLGIVKIDFLGLGMMAVLQDTFELCAAQGGTPRSFDDIPPDDPETYEKIRAADTVGVFQIESRAQMATLPRFKPRDLYDLAMQVAIIRPGPITGNLVHPLIRRRDGIEEVDYIHPSVAHIVKPILERTKGVILFQEQMLQLAINLAKFTGGEAEELRRAMGFTKNPERLVRSMEKLTLALRRQGYAEEVVQKVVHATTTFSAYGFPESHAIGFAMLAYFSTWLKIHRPAPFYAALLNNQPMGFYSPATLLQDAKRGGRDLKANPVCVCASRWECTVESDGAIRIGLRYVKGIREAAVARMLAARKIGAFTSLDDFLRRTDFTATERRALAAIGALNALSRDRRTALWDVEAAWSEGESLFRQFADAYREGSPLARMSPVEEIQADFAGLGLTTNEHPMAALRAQLADVTPASALKETSDGQRVTIAGSVICRQRPGTAKGFVFISLEDETGIANAVVLPQLFERLRLVITQEPSLRITGSLQNVSGVQHVKAEIVEPLRCAALPVQASHDFR
ncbi:MAG: error-prone DNA polymerase [Opitutae bacterium]|nr:error-prone DNA polymerase [Opitutae bacterium]